MNFKSIDCIWECFVSNMTDANGLRHRTLAIFKPNQLIPTTRVGMLNTVSSRCACLIDLTETLFVHRRSVYRSWENQGQIWQMYPKNCISQMRLNADVGFFQYFSRSDRRF